MATEARDNAARTDEQRQQLRQAKKLNAQAGDLREEGKATAAIDLAEQAKAIREKVLGKQHHLYATNLNNLAGLYESMGEYGRAEPLLVEAKAIRETDFRTRREPSSRERIQEMSATTRRQV